MNTTVLRAVFRRNFVSYFANPTGYIFICVFVLLTSLAAFCPNEFFNANLANLDQLNRFIFLIMLFFIPTITMGIWSDERRQGTDELLLTIPASDLDIVLGKYLAAVSVFSVSLLFSLACSFAVFKALLGDPDVGLFLGTYLGYWLVGLAMLSIGMVASFLVGNLTIAFVLGVLFNAPLVLAFAADAAFGPKLAPLVKQWSLGGQFRDFSRGIWTFSATAYFLMITAVMLYLCMILIGRRHWRSGWQQQSMALHYTLRVLALIVAAGGLTLILQSHDARCDMTYEQISSLSPQTRELLAGLKPDRPIEIQAFISPTVPEEYVQTRLNVLTVLRELEARGGKKVHLRVYDTDRFSEEGKRAEHAFGIYARPVRTMERGARGSDTIYLGVAMTSGRQKVVVPFIDKGIPVEYELVRSLATVAQQKRKRVGVLNTEAPLFGRFNMQSMSVGQNSPIIDELQKQYEVVQVDASKPLVERYDVLLAVQPSSLAPEAMENFLAAVRGGQPTAIFEDPCPAMFSEVTPTSMPRRPPQNPMMAFASQQAQPKGDIRPLWDMLGVGFAADKVVWQNYNPYPSHFPDEFVFINHGEGSKEPFGGKDPISAKLQQVLLLFPGAIDRLNASDLDFVPLLCTGTNTGDVPLGEIMQRGAADAMLHQRPTKIEYVLAAHIRGKLKPEPRMPPAGEINVVLVADIDMLATDFFQLREWGELPGMDVPFTVDNVTFVLNALDELAGDHRFIDIRSRRPTYRTLTRIENRTNKSKAEATKARDKYEKECKQKEDDEEAAIEKKLAELRSRKASNSMDTLNELGIAAEEAKRRLDSTREQLRQERDREINKIETDLTLEVRGVQNRSKWLAVILPLIPPLLVGGVVFSYRRVREREGVSRKRLR
jgi:ABC-2 type transport system permease protein